jgi:hypothetical protein
VLFPRKGITTLDHVVSTIPHQVNIWFVEIVYEYSGINLHPRSGNKEFLIKRGYEPSYSDTAVDRDDKAGGPEISP